MQNSSCASVYLKNHFLCPVSSSLLLTVYISIWESSFLFYKFELDFLEDALIPLAPFIEICFPSKLCLFLREREMEGGAPGEGES